MGFSSKGRLMKVQQFLAHYGITENPFSPEDAQTDHIFRKFCLHATHHPAWDKIYGNPESPGTSVVFGEKGSGKTALRLQIVDELAAFNRAHPDRRCFVIEYDDFNPFLDAFRDRLHGRKRRTDRMFAQWRLWDHMDAILSLGITRLVRAVTVARDKAETERTDGVPAPRADAAPIETRLLDRLSRDQKRDLLLLAAFYEHSYDRPPRSRWNALRRALRFSTWRTKWDVLLGLLVTVLTVVLVVRFGGGRELFQHWWVAAVIVAGWLPWLLWQARLLWTSWRTSWQIRVFDHLTNTLRGILAQFERKELRGQPIPMKDRSDDRYELLAKFQAILQSLGFVSIVVAVDRVDEPHLVNGSPERMREFLWPMFDNKFLKHPGLGFKLLLPAEVANFLKREEKEFYERSRLDKQNLVLSLEWTGESLYDVANDRMRGCADSGHQAVSIRDLFDPSIDERELIGTFARLRVPRHLFKFLYRLLVEHANRYTDANPCWKIGRETLHSTVALYLRDLEALDRGLGPG
jgi:hypothetical protein